MNLKTEEHIDLRDYLQVVLKRKWTIIGVLAVVVVAVAFRTYTAAPIYKASIRMVIEKENPNVVSIEEVMSVDASGSDYYQTQYRIIESRGVAREVIRRLGLDQSEEFFPRSKDDFLSRWKRALRAHVAAARKAMAGLTRTEASASPSGDRKGLASDSALVSEFIERIDVRPIRNSRLVDVGFEARDPQMAAHIVNTLADSYIDQSLEIKLQAAQDAVEWLNMRIVEERQKVQKAESALLRYKEENNIVTDFSSDVEKVNAQKLAQINSQVVDFETRRVEAQNRYKQAVALRNTPDMIDSIPEVLNNQLIRQIKTMEVDIYQRRSELSKKYGANHPRMVALAAELKTLEKRKAKEIERVINYLGNEYKVALAREKSLKAAFERQKSESLALNKKAIAFGVLQREAESARDMYELLVKRFKETSLTEEMRTGNIRIIDRAEVPRHPIKPKKKRNLLLALIVGVALGLGLAFFFEYLDNTVKVPQDVTEFLKVPYLGCVPFFKPEKNDDTVSDQLVTVQSPKSTAGEAYRGVRTSVLFSSAEVAPQVLLVCSAGPREGKTLTSVNLAAAMVQAGSQVLVVDGDLRRPRIHRVLGGERDKGLSNLLVEGAGGQKVVCRSGLPGLDFITCGPIPPNPSELLGSDRMRRLVVSLRKRYDHIIIDSPPVTAVTDALLLSKLVDGVVLVIRAGETPRQIAKNSLAMFESVGARMAGAVLNCVDLGRDSYYYYHYYYYYYGEDSQHQKGRRRGRRSSGRHGA